MQSAELLGLGLSLGLVLVIAFLGLAFHSGLRNNGNGNVCIQVLKQNLGKGVNKRNTLGLSRKVVGPSGSKSGSLKVVRLNRPEMLGNVLGNSGE